MTRYKAHDSGPFTRPPTGLGFRLRFPLIFIAVVAAFGWAGQADYEDARRIECGTAAKPRGYDAESDRCINPTQPTNPAHAAPKGAR